MKFYFKLLSIVLITIFAVSAYAETPADLFEGKIKTAEKIVEQIEPSDLMKMIRGKKDFLLIDVRQKEEVLAGKIESINYMNISRGLLDVIASKGAVSPEKEIVIYCKKGSRGLLSAAALKELGFKNVKNLKGGIHNWMNSGYPITNSLGSFKTVPYELTGCAE